MKFSDFVVEKAIRADLAAEDKEGVIEELVSALVAAGAIQASERDSIVKCIMKREELGSTGIGRGVAVPHTKHPSVEELVGTVGVSAEGVDFTSLDGSFFFWFRHRIVLGIICGPWKTSLVNCVMTLFAGS